MHRPPEHTDGPPRTAHEANDLEDEVVNPRQLTRRYDPGALHERALDAAGGCMGWAAVASFALLALGLMRWVMRRLFPSVAGWRWWVLAVAMVLSVLWLFELPGELRTSGRPRLWPPKLRELILIACLTVILLVGVLRI